MRFRKRPFEVEAEQWWPENDHAIAGVNVDYRNNQATVMTPNGPVEITPGEWIITGVSGEKYPCKPDIFEKLYERVH